MRSPSVYRLLRTGALKCHRVGKAARITETQIAEYLSGASNVAPSAPGGLDLTIKCPRCEEELVRHRSENLVDDLTTRYSADCRKCKLRILYQVVKFDGWDESIDEVVSGPGGDVIGEDLGEALVGAQGGEKVDGEVTP
jgi:transcription elongation factor Elf1